ncbi:hypothetical protein [Bacteroides sedimenti]|uniref:DUF3868 domain-containing protein n=1 Tax=Bacteroides sedimenti TaxID=2136147 RepID=A0ABN6ZB31_9BACE
MKEQGSKQGDLPMVKKGIFSLLVVFLLGINCQSIAQEKPTNFVPLLFDTVKVGVNYKRERLCIKDTLIQDSLRILFRVALKFEYPLNDISKPVIVKSVELTDLHVKSLTTNKQFCIYHNERKMSRYQREIWNRYSRMFDYWYRNQPYEKLVYRQEYGDLAYLGGVLYTTYR